MPQSINNLPVGAKVRDNGTTYYGAPIVWRIVDKNHSGYPANSVTLLSDNIIKYCVFDANEPNNPDEDAQQYGNSKYEYSNIRQWLNKSGTSWYTPQYTYDAPPSLANTYRWLGSSEPSNYDYSYENEPGFLTTFSSNFLSSILTTNVICSHSFSEGDFTVLPDKVFLLALREVDPNGHWNGEAINGISTLTWFLGEGTTIKSTPTPQLISKYPKYYNDASIWMLRTRSSHRGIYYGDWDSSENKFETSAITMRTDGLRPAINVSSTLKVSDSPDSSGVYTIFWNTPPSPTTSVNVPTSVYKGSSINISWPAAYDAEGNITNYILERSQNGSSSWTQIFSGNALNYVDTAPLADINTIQYRVKVVDSGNESSGYTTSSVVTVIYNYPPSAPASITVPSSAYKGTSINVSWPVASDYDNNVTHYILERSQNEALPWTQVLSNNVTSFVDTAPAGINSVRYRVKAVDSYNEESEYTTSSMVTIINNYPPSAPGSIEATNVVINENATITWGASTDSDGTISSYVLEHRVDGGPFTQIYTGTALTYSDTIGAEWGTVTYRVKAIDDYGDSSEYTISSVIEVQEGVLIINGPLFELGEKPSPFVFEFYITDSGSQSVTNITTKVILDNNEIYSGLPSTNTVVSIPIDCRLMNVGNHSITVTASKESYISNTKKYSFEIPAYELPDGGNAEQFQNPNGEAIFPVTLGRYVFGPDGKTLNEMPGRIYEIDNTTLSSMSVNELKELYSWGYCLLKVTDSSTIKLRGLSSEGVVQTLQF